MSNSRTAFSASIFAVFTWPILTATAQQSTPSPTPGVPPSIEDRVGNLENNVGQILDILKKQQAAPVAPSAQSPSTAPQSPPVGGQPGSTPPAPKIETVLRPGAILEVWTLKSDFSGDAPTGRSVGGMLDQGDYFSLLNFTEEHSLASLQTNRIALRWGGLFRAKETGVYVFTLEWASARGVSPVGETSFWTANLSIDSQTLIKESPQIIERGSRTRLELTFSSSAEVQLEAGGIYPLTLLTFIAAQTELPTTNWNYDKMKLTLKVRGPSDMTPRTITSKDLFHK